MLSSYVFDFLGNVLEIQHVPSPVHEARRIALASSRENRFRRSVPSSAAFRILLHGLNDPRNALNVHQLHTGSGERLSSSWIVNQSLYSLVDSLDADGIAMTERMAQVTGGC